MDDPRIERVARAIVAAQDLDPDELIETADADAPIPRWRLAVADARVHVAVFDALNDIEAPGASNFDAFEIR